MSTALPSSARQYHCPWCGYAGDAASPTCPACGAAVDVRLATTDSGWAELPAIKDMTKIQFGQSFCQIEGKYVPIVDFNLAQGDGVYFAHHLLLWKDDGAKISKMPLKKAFKRLLAGMPLIMAQAAGPGRIAFSKDQPGELIALPLRAGEAVDVREHVFMVATSQIAYDWFDPQIWYRTSSGNERVTHYPVGWFMDRFTAGGSPGLLILHGAGNVFVRTLEAGQTILIKPTSLLFKDPTVAMNLHIEVPSQPPPSWFANWTQRYVWIRLRGPGRVAVQSHFAFMEERGLRMGISSPGTTQQSW
jgi:uncharacterized protein (AIM24 family)